tara:strand:- start:986 stop:1204 length:219 start_codon:yes stop_codon:yes gene_type:complete
MSIYNEYVPRKRKPFKTVTVEYFEEFEKDTSRVSPMWQGPGVRRIRIVTTTSSYNMGSAKSDPVVSTTYEYL